MAKYTVTKRIRMELHKAGEKIMPAIPRAAFGCRVCGGSMLTADGQIAYYHKECRHKTQWQMTNK